jgi:regulator of replication initiation timing
MKNPITFVYVGGNLGVVGGHHEDPSKTLVRLTDYVELEAKLKRLAMDSLHDLNQIGGLQEENATLKAEVEYLRGFCTRTIIPNDVLKAEVERLTDAITKGAMTPDAKPFDEVERLKEEIQVLQSRCDFLEGRGQQ